VIGRSAATSTQSRIVVETMTLIIAGVATIALLLLWVWLALKD
jgi:cytochrome P450